MPTRLALPLLVLMLAACARIDVSTLHDASAARLAGGYRTYAWVPPAPGQPPRTFCPEPGVSVEKSVDAYLQSRGYRLAESGATPDFLIHWAGALDAGAVRAPAIHTGPRRSPVRSPRTGADLSSIPAAEPSSRDALKGVLDLNILDASTKKLVWRGTAEGILVHDARPGEIQDWLNQATSKLLEDFPPKAVKD